MDCVNVPKARSVIAWSVSVVAPKSTPAWRRMRKKKIRTPSRMKEADESRREKVFTVRLDVVPKVERVEARVCLQQTPCARAPVCAVQRASPEALAQLHPHAHLHKIKNWTVACSRFDCRGRVFEYLSRAQTSLWSSSYCRADGETAPKSESKIKKTNTRCVFFLQINNPLLFLSASTCGLRTVNPESVFLKIHKDAAVAHPVSGHKHAPRTGEASVVCCWVFLTVTNCLHSSLLRTCSYSRFALLQTVFGRFRPSAKALTAGCRKGGCEEEEGGPNFSYTPPKERPLCANHRAPWRAAPSSLAERLVSGGGVKMEGAEQLESHCQLWANQNQGSGGIRQQRSVIGVYYGEVWWRREFCHTERCDSQHDCTGRFTIDFETLRRGAKG